MKIRNFAGTLTVCLLVSSCAGSFNKKWEQSLSLHPAPYTEITGPWEGRWKSDANGHNGELQCIVDETGENRYKFLYRATWNHGMKGTFRIDCEGNEKGAVTQVRGTKKLGPFGTYQHDATITPTTFQAEFSSKKNNLGNFELSRPK